MGVRGVFEGGTGEQERRGGGAWLAFGLVWRLGLLQREGVDTIILFSNILRSFIFFPSSSLSHEVAGREGWGEWKVVTASHFSNAMTAYRKLPFAYPLLIARKDCKKAIPSRPWLKANPQRDGFWISDHEISLPPSVKSIALRHEILTKSC